MSVTRINPKPFLGANINGKVTSTKVDEVINLSNTNETNTATNTAAILAMNPDTGVGAILSKKVTLTATEIVGSAAGDIGHASGATILAAPGAGLVYEVLGVTLIYDFGVAAYTGGAGDVVLAYGAGAAITSAITAANLLTAAADKLLTLKPIATEVVPVANSVVALRGTAYTQPGTAAGVLRVHISYRIHTTGL